MNLKVNNKPVTMLLTTENSKPGRTSLQFKGFETRSSVEYGTYLDFTFEDSSGNATKLGAPLNDSMEIRPKTKLYGIVCSMLGMKVLPEDIDVEGELTNKINHYYDVQLEISKDSKTKLPKCVADDKPDVFYMNVGIIYGEASGGISSPPPAQQAEIKSPTEKYQDEQLGEAVIKMLRERPMLIHDIATFFKEYGVEEKRILSIVKTLTDKKILKIDIFSDKYSVR